MLTQINSNDYEIRALELDIKIAETLNFPIRRVTAIRHSGNREAYLNMLEEYDEAVRNRPVEYIGKSGMFDLDTWERITLSCVACVAAMGIVGIHWLMWVFVALSVLCGVVAWDSRNVED